MTRAAAAALAAVLTAGCAAGTRTAPARVVVVEGWAPLSGAPAPEARRRALADAERRAVEEGAGVEIAAVATVDDAARVRERVSAAALGRVRRLKVLGERVSGGVLRVRVRAEVEAPGAGPRVGWIPGTGPSARVSVSGGAPGEAAALREAFVAAWSSYGGEAADEGASAEVLIRLAVQDHPVDEPRVRPFVSARVRVLASARAAGGGTIWAAARESAALGLDAGQARERAAARAAEAAAEAAARDLPARLRGPARGEGR